MSKKKKIIHLTFDMRIGGTESVIKNLVEGTDQLKYDIEVLCIEPKLGPFGEQLVEKGYEVNSLSWRGGFDKQVIRDIRQFIKTKEVDILHCHQYSPWVYGALAAAYTKTKVIFTEHGRFYPDTSSWKRRLVNPFLIALTNHITTISKATKQALVDFEFIPKSKIEVIYNGIAPLVPNLNIVQQIKSEHNIPKHAKMLGTVARLDPIKNQIMMIKAFADVLETFPESYLMIVGDGEEKEALKKVVEHYNIDKHVIFTGYISKPVNHITAMDVFLLSSLSEGTSMTLLEAMSLSKPCVVTDAGGNAEIILNDYNGMVTPNDNCDAFSLAIKKLLLDENITESMKDAAYTRFIDFFDYKCMTGSYEKVYESLVAIGRV